MDRTLIKFIIVDALKPENKSTDYSKYSLLITPPRSSTSTLVQTINDSVKYKIPKSGAVQLELVPSYYLFDDYYNTSNYVHDFPTDNLYKVELYSKYQSLPLSEWHWLVPPPQPEYSYTVKYAGEPIKLESKLKVPVKVKPEGYSVKETVEGVELDWENLTSGSEVELTYKVAYTLADVESFYGGLFSADKRRKRIQNRPYWYYY